MNARSRTSLKSIMNPIMASLHAEWQALVDDVASLEQYDDDDESLLIIAKTVKKHNTLVKSWFNIDLVSLEQASDPRLRNPALAIGVLCLARNRASALIGGQFVY